jgi:hypothetical protein
VLQQMLVESDAGLFASCALLFGMGPQRSKGGTTRTGGNGCDGVEVRAQTPGVFRCQANPLLTGPSFRLGSMDGRRQSHMNVFISSTSA